MTGECVINVEPSGEAMQLNCPHVIGTMLSTVRFGCPGRVIGTTEEGNPCGSLDVLCSIVSHRSLLFGLPPIPVEKCVLVLDTLDH